MTLLKDQITAWLETAQSNGAVSATDLDQLRQITAAAQPRQRLLYLHAKGPSIYAPVIGMAEHGPTPDGKDRIRTRESWPYNSVHEAILDGWFVIHFPQQMAPYDDRELDYAGFEFVLQKTEEVIS